MKCSVANCGMTQSKKRPYIKFHYIPSNQSKRDAWIANIGRDNLRKTSKRLVLCTLHFTEDAFNRTLTVVRLRDDAMPTIFDKKQLRETMKQQEKRYKTMRQQSTRQQPMRQPRQQSTWQQSMSQQSMRQQSTRQQLMKQQSTRQQLMKQQSTRQQSMSQQSTRHISMRQQSTRLQPMSQQCSNSELICRICVQSCSKLLSIESYGLRTAYEQLTGVSVEHDDGLPRELCVECATLLDKYHKFRDKSIKGDQLLRQIYNRENNSQTLKPLEEIEESINSLASTIDFSPEVTVLDIEPIRKDVVEQSMHDLEMSVTDDNNDLTQNIDRQMIRSNDLDQQDRTIATVIDSSDNEELDSAMTNEKDVYIVRKNRNETVIGSDNDTISIKEEEELDPLNSLEVTKAQDSNLIEMNYYVNRLEFEEQVQQHVKRKYNPGYMSSEFKCHSCYKGFVSKQSFEDHTQSLHSLERCDKVCVICQIRYTDDTELDYHKESTHEYNYECKHCKEIMLNSKSALRHIKMHIQS